MIYELKTEGKNLTYNFWDYNLNEEKRKSYILKTKNGVHFEILVKKKKGRVTLEIVIHNGEEPVENIKKVSKHIFSEYDSDYVLEFKTEKGEENIPLIFSPDAIVGEETLYFADDKLVEIKLRLKFNRNRFDQELLDEIFDYWK